jgi:hypothetical protein
MESESAAELGGVGGGIGNGRTRYGALFGQTLSAALSSPTLSPWRGATFQASLAATAFNYSNGRHGASPGVTMGFAQRLGKTDLRLDYTYDGSSLGLYGSTGASSRITRRCRWPRSLSSRMAFSTFLSNSLSDDSVYGSADLSYAIGAKRAPDCSLTFPDSVREPRFELRLEHRSLHRRARSVGELRYPRGKSTLNWARTVLNQELQRTQKAQRFQNLCAFCVLCNSWLTRQTLFQIGGERFDERRIAL